MSLPFDDKPLKLQLKSSRGVNIMILVTHLLVAVIIALVTSSILLVSLSFLIVSLSYLYFYRLHVVKRLRQSIVEVSLATSGDWSVLTSTGQYENVMLLPSSFSSQYLIILNFCTVTTKRYTLLIVKGMMGEDGFRHLRIRLKIINK
jgi:hypothetical protein